ncbi:MAG: 16S rRNA (uracil(1498)-N(3))-methyltransferase [Roseofilum sp. SBFL]|uniref:16S rRNA (uracil(1498)-N(3))-methyltransferase n=1 Tax=unclassified Roseofilum TaxID=2620099 RepID=UPI001B272095|nr:MULTISPECIES: 16S rRNA (uracil(1498)-N(3))-methyltransferase [unclassified Roseofilum]MBP0012636.1 16S rRNA (uracil(1498)-N(3))-methyltransferase [Roseofilum sp. SID3]MBP0023140.1 16S rRNA (uracil(1498)-N(3))-methyltransferase [Roseofilum sp. SID2]MBP0039946.1 16S rRNA (uracil(1498)-N(3))-methyltransferase [Roseofilum sp. SID1]MBP0042291.1 16S rRNA (uracil(1498)-N(3))-methyltransferase [Roseofilum sp. SBFL]
MTQWQRVAIAPEQLDNDIIRLTPQQQHYLYRVLRLQPGDRFIALIQPEWWLSELCDLETAQRLEMIPMQTELAIAITLMVALPKNGFEEIIRCCTELGVMEIMPVITDRTLLKPRPQKLERWRRIATESAEQCERQHIPTIADPLSFTQAMQTPHIHPYLAVTRISVPHLLTLPLPSPSETILIATGPEGGWTPQEVEEATIAGFQPISLGQRILRAVTAPIVALSLLAGHYEIN